MGEGDASYIFFVYLVIFITLHRNLKMFKLSVANESGSLCGRGQKEPGVLLQELNGSWDRQTASSDRKKYAIVPTGRPRTRSLQSASPHLISEGTQFSAHLDLREGSAGFERCAEWKGGAISHGGIHNAGIRTGAPADWPVTCPY